MENKELKELLKQYLLNTPNEKLGSIFKEISKNDLDIIFSRPLLDYLSKNDENFKERIKEVDLSFLQDDISKIKKELIRHRYSRLCLDYSYDDNDSINGDDPLNYLFVKSYSLVLKCLQSHLVEEAYKIVRLMKNIRVAYIYDVLEYDECVDESEIIFGDKREDYLNNINHSDDEIYDYDDEEENESYSETLYIEDFHDIEDYFYYLNVNFQLKDLDYVELLYIVKSSSFVEGVSNYIKKKDDEGVERYSLDFKRLLSELSYDVDTYISLLNDVMLVLVKTIGNFSPFFRGIEGLEGDITPIIETAKKYPCCYKYARDLFNEKSHDLIIAHLPYFVEQKGELDRYDLEDVNLIIKAASKLHRYDLIIKYAPISYRLEPYIAPLIYLKALAPEETLINVNAINPRKAYSVLKQYEASLVLGHISEYALSSFENEKALGWSNNYSNALLTILELMIYKKDDDFHNYLVRKLNVFINDFRGHVDEEYINLYIDKIKKIETKKNLLVNTIEKVIVNRIKEIVFNNCRHSYYKAAILLKELEVINDTYHLIKIDLAALLNALRSHPAFTREYKSIDLLSLYKNDLN